jgi:hypothetical protein
VQKCQAALGEALQQGFPREHWLAYVLDFCDQPSKASLAELIRRLGPHSSGYGEISYHLPWIIHYAVRLYAECGDAAVGMIEEGYLGDASDWSQLEDGWRLNSGINAESDDIAVWSSGGREFLPVAASRLGYSRSTATAKSITSLMKTLTCINDVNGQGWRTTSLGLLSQCREM